MQADPMQRRAWETGSSGVDAGVEGEVEMRVLRALVQVADMPTLIQISRSSSYKAPQDRPAFPVPAALQKNAQLCRHAHPKRKPHALHTPLSPCCTYTEVGAVSSDALLVHV